MELSHAGAAQWLPASTSNRDPVQTPRSDQDTKLIVLSTGTQLKLYPLSESNQVSAHKYYVFKPRAIGWDPAKRTNQGHSELVRSGRAEDQRDRLQVAPSKPFIANLDTFVDPRFCPNATYCDTCLVVVWFDQSDHSIHYGSADMRTVQPRNGTEINNASSGGSRIDQPTLARQVDRVLYLNEYVPPIAVCQTCNLLSLVVDKVRLKVYYAVNDTLTTTGEFGRRFIGSVILKTLRDTSGTHERELISERLDRRQAINSLIVDELSGSSLYYLDSTTKARVLQLGSKDSLGRVRNALGRQMELNSIVNVKMDEGVLPPAKIAGLVWSTLHQRFYWLTDSTNQIYSSDVTGDNVVRIGEINSKPFIRSVDRMHLLDDTLFLSDSIKKSIISYGLKNMNNNHTDSHASRHRVVLVEMPTVLDFKPIDLREVYHIEGLSCFDDDKTQFCTRSIRLLDITKWQQQKYASSSNFTCDALAVDWKQAVSSKQLDITKSEQSITWQQEPINGKAEPTFDLESNQPQEGDEKHLFLWQSVGVKHQISMQYICCGSIVAAVVVIVLLLIVYVIRYCCLRAKQQNHLDKRYTVRPYLLRPELKIDKRPLVAIIDCETYP